MWFTGGRAIGRPTGAIAAGNRADLVVLNGGDPALAYQKADNVLDAAILGPCRQPVRDVMSNGVWIVQDGHHVREAEVFARYRVALRMRWRRAARNKCNPRVVQSALSG